MHFKPSKRKIAVVTSTRADYGILRPLLKKIQSDPDLELNLIVTGTHLSPEFGYTYREIEADSLEILRKIEIAMSSDSGVGAAKSAGLACICLADALADLKPDLLVVLGDRFEILSVVMTAVLLRIPVAHLSGGDLTEGAVDDSIRHAITKLSSLHFPTTEAYKSRLIQMGEDPHRVFNYGSLAIDTILDEKLMSQQEWELQFNFEITNSTILVTFHPATIAKGVSGEHFRNLLRAIELIPEITAIFTFPNLDPESRELRAELETFIKRHPNKHIAFESLGWKGYLSALSLVSAVVGNSSSGLTEAPSFGTPTVNIGDRQKGRITAASVINCGPVTDEIVSAMKVALSRDFGLLAKESCNPYGTGSAAINIKKVLKEVNLESLNVKKFFDLNFSPTSPQGN